MVVLLFWLAHTHIHRVHMHIICKVIKLFICSSLPFTKFFDSYRRHTRSALFGWQSQNDDSGGRRESPSIQKYHSSGMGYIFKHARGTKPVNSVPKHGRMGISEMFRRWIIRIIAIIIQTCSKRNGLCGPSSRPIKYCGPIRNYCSTAVQSPIGLNL